MTETGPKPAPRPAKRTAYGATVILRVPASWVPKLDECAERRETTRSEFLRLVVRQVLEAEDRRRQAKDTGRTPRKETA